MQSRLVDHMERGQRGGEVAVADSGGVVEQEGKED